VVHVNDASRAVTVVGDLLQKESSDSYKAGIKQDYQDFRKKFLKRGKEKEYRDIEQARANKFSIKWETDDIAIPKELGVQVISDFELDKLVDYIDWSPFFRSWDLHGKYPQILEDDVVGPQARELYEDATGMLAMLIREKKVQARAVFGIFEANSIGDDDIEVVRDENTFVFRTLRQQLKKREGVPNIALADFIAPKSTGITDYIGCFCVSAGFGTAELAGEYQRKLDDYNSIMVKALTDRLAEAFAEYLHEQVRKVHWGYAKGERLDNQELIGEAYRGIRPAPGYPACPDHLEKQTIWEILNVQERIGVSLTESLAMWPAASVSGYYFAHPQAKYFGLGKIKQDQLQDYADRKGLPIEEALKWLAPNMAEDSK
jgi:5-methyltetrahydrofolate--homocysteine methyltransferase